MHYDKVEKRNLISGGRKEKREGDLTVGDSALHRREMESLQSSQERRGGVNVSPFQKEGRKPSFKDIWGGGGTQRPNDRERVRK